MKYKVFIEKSSKEYEDMFLKQNFEITKEYKEADLIQFTGGPDVHPSYYKENKHSKTNPDSKRDEIEYSLFNSCWRYHIPMAGICRGAQFLNVMNHGKLWQHVDGHTTGEHPLIDKKTRNIICQVSSTHHQMMRPFEGRVLAVAKEATFLENYNSKYGCTLTEHEDIEVVYFKTTNSLCFQPHPEFHGYEECRKYYFNLLFEYLLKKEPKGSKKPIEKSKYICSTNTFATINTDVITW